VWLEVVNDEALFGELLAGLERRFGNTFGWNRADFESNDSRQGSRKQWNAVSTCRETTGLPVTQTQSVFAGLLKLAFVHSWVALPAL